MNPLCECKNVILRAFNNNFILTDKPPTDVLTFYIDESEMFIPGNLPGVLFSIHSPYEAVNPFENGIFMKPGRTYRIYVQMVSARILYFE